MNPMITPVAVAVSDLHLTLNPPSCRAETDWLEVQKRYLEELRRIANKVPVLIAGDIFDRWNAPAELIHFALRHLPDRVYSVPGQHDLPFHRLDLVHRSAYGVLVAAGKVMDISESRVQFGPVAVYGFAWGQEPEPPWDPDEIPVALVHRYLYPSSEFAYPGAREGRIDELKAVFRRYHVVISGDNHIPWEATRGKTLFWNCGTFIRRKLDEIRYHPRVAVLYSDGSIRPVPLDTKEDRFVEGTSPDVRDPGFEDFLEGLESLQLESLDFRSCVEEWIEKNRPSRAVRELLLQSLEVEHDRRA